MPVLAITLAFLVLNGLLWHARPTPGFWLLGSLVLGGLWGLVFLRVITSRGVKAK
jgi:uncharacterized membrane protein AbrB (regulator of aidB expression)